MEIWLCTIEYPPFFAGGISTYCKNTVDLFTKKNNKVKVIIFDPNLDKKIFEIKKVNRKLYEIRFNFRNNDFYKSLGFTAKLSYEFSEVIKDLIFKHNLKIPDIIEFHDYLGIGYYTLQRKYCLEKPFKDLKIITTSHTPSFISKKYNYENIYKFPDFWTGEMEKFQLIASDGVAFPSRFIYKKITTILSKKKFGITKIIRYPFIKNFETKNSKKLENYVILYGKFQPLKGFIKFLENLVKTGSKIKYKIKIYANHNFIYIENKNSEEIIKEKFKSLLETKQLEIHNALPFKKLFKKILKAKFVIVPSLIETFPFVVIESMHLGKCVITTPYGGQSEIIKNNKNGFIFDLYNPESFKKIIKKINTLSDDEILKIGENAKKTVSEFLDNEKTYESKISFIKSIKNRISERKFPSLNEENQLPKIEKNPLVSVIMPYYNMGQFIDESLKSVISSKYSNLEILIINDGSNEPYSINKIHILEKKYLNKINIKILHKQNEGLALTRNFGADNAQGKIIVFLDPDDKISFEYIKKGVEILTYYKNVAFCCSWAKYFGLSDNYFITHNSFLPYSLIHNPMNTSSLIIRKEIFQKFGKNDYSLCFGLEDYDMLLNFLENNYYGIALPYPLFFYRIRKKSMSSTFFNYASLNFSYNKIFKKHEQFYKKYLHQILSILNSNGPCFMYDNPTFESPLINFFINKDNKIYNTELNNQQGVLIDQNFKLKIKRFIERKPLLKKAIYKVSVFLNKL